MTYNTRACRQGSIADDLIEYSWLFGLQSRVRVRTDDVVYMCMYLKRPRAHYNPYIMDDDP